MLIGFSTGALALGDFKQAIQLQSSFDLNAVELSALRESEVDMLIGSLDDLNLSGLDYVSFHAPSSLQHMGEDYLVNRLRVIAERNWPIVVHPDVIRTPQSWNALGASILIENMDQRKPVGRTVLELEDFFDELPEARFCFDIGHARQVDPTMSVAVELLLHFGDRLAEVHLSEVNPECRHVALSSVAVRAYQRVSSLIPKSVPVILESMVQPNEIQRELTNARQCFWIDTRGKRKRHLVA